MKLKFGMIGGTGGFIGSVHRKAACFDEMAEMVCGAFSRNPEKNLQSGTGFGIEKSRIYDDYRLMAQKEKGEIDFAVVVTANNSHFDVCKAFLEQGIHVMCDKPVTTEAARAEELLRITKEKNLLFAVSYSYMGYPMIHQAGELIKSGEIGDIFQIVCEYSAKGRLAGLLDGSLLKPGGKYDPSVVGKMSAVLDIGTHVFYTTEFITGLRLRRVLARFDYKPADLSLEVGASILTEYENGAGGNYWMSMVALGHDNDSRIRIFGTKGAIDWCHKEPGTLKVSPVNKPIQLYTAGNLYNHPNSRGLSRIPAGHPEGFVSAVANVYRMFYENLLAKRAGKNPVLPYPSLADGLKGIKYAEACYASQMNSNSWVDID
jgi:predicted dehydrogenase